MFVVVVFFLGVTIYMQACHCGNSQLAPDVVDQGDDQDADGQPSNVKEGPRKREPGECEAGKLNRKTKNRKCQPAGW